METAALEVPTIDGEEAERTITAAVITVPGVQWATAEAATGTVSVQYDAEETGIGELRCVIESAGYEPARTAPGAGGVRDGRA
jgi:copper chaperone CopZ